MNMADSDKADLVIRGARLIDGTGGPSLQGDIAVTDDRIAALGDLGRIKGAVEIEAGGRAVAPGFIDVHTHDDRALLIDPAMTCKVSQGVTTVVAGNCGVSLAPLALRRPPPAPLDLVCDSAEGFFADFGPYLDRLDGTPAAVNALCQVGHSSLRAGAMEDLDRPASGAEIAAMRGALERALEAGAIGLSTGLDYAPAAAAPTGEVIALAEAVGVAGGLHSTHMRNEADRVMDSLEETFAIGRAARVPVVISHHKCAGEANHGRSAETLALIHRARQGQAVGLDAYPYNAASTVLERSFIEKASRVIVTWSKARPEVAGRDLAGIAREMGLGLQEAAEALQPAGGIFFTMDEADVRRILAYPGTMIGSDGLPHDAFPHPRLWGTFPRVLGHYARDVGLFPLEEAVHRMTGLPARRFGLAKRGALRPGAFADLVLFDPETVIDTATFEAPKTPAAGIDLVLVNGRAVWRDGETTGARPGRAIRLQALADLGSAV
ncbi:MAG: D-aminoacylase [Rhodospirillales bacterium]|nr:D-aminoacylase [Rhodospirillales bacterium]MDH3790273.1 D-aminoacylase [Rhodospirillales bacterium]MDH3909867.1 D-aminoacylase [Rhodospirillales bacterium]MDH3919605.1 D-aminoacylase [Rhodospirillales bacterium]